MMSDVNDVMDASAVDQDLSQGSLNENVKELLERRFQEVCPLLVVSLCRYIGMCSMRLTGLICGTGSHR